MPLHQTAAKNIIIDNRVGDKIGLFDYRRIVHVLVNLLSNAKFSNNNSQIYVTCDKARNGKVKVSVIDKAKV